jgi:hypothetical protein
MKSPVTRYQFLGTLFLLALLSAFSPVFAQDEYANIKRWETFDFRGRNITA